jgi:hypothetical protein
MRQNVIELTQYPDRDHFPALRTIGNYWNNLADGAVPYRCDLDPRGLPDALRNIVYGNVSSGNARIRISGRYLCDVLIEDGRDLPCSLWFNGENRSLALDIFGQVFDIECPKTLWLGCAEGTWSGKMTLYPLRVAYDINSKVLAGIEGSAPIAQPIKFHAQLTPIPITMQESELPLNFVDAAFSAKMEKSRAYLRRLDQTVSDK